MLETIRGPQYFYGDNVYLNTVKFFGITIQTWQAKQYLTQGISVFVLGYSFFILFNNAYDILAYAKGKGEPLNRHQYDWFPVTTSSGMILYKMGFLNE